MPNRLNKFYIASTIAALLLTVLVVDIYRTMNSQLVINDTQFIDLKRGDSITSLAKALHEKGYLKYPAYLTIWARALGVTTQLKAGEYSIQAGDTLSDLLNKMVAGKVERYKLTLVEGWAFKEMLQSIYINPYIVRTLPDMPANLIMKKLGYENLHPEGRFYPDTYFIDKQTTDIDVLKRSFNTMEKILDTQWQMRDDNLPFKTSYEALILASIVEKESAVADERAKIAGVFINRLRKKMRLQTDPTVIYGMGDAYNGDIRFKDLRNDTPYNTYTRHGLPPTPIAMPGLAAIVAVMHPEATDALYFVAYGDESGRHFFSSNLRDHQRAVKQYQMKR